MNTLPSNTTERRYDLDWLRVLAFFVLIFYHTGQYYVADWGWHIKSETTSTFLQNIMIFTNPWRMSLMFFISGMALALVINKYKISTLLQTKLTRILIPFLFGMFVIVSPQPYIEFLDQGLINPGFWAFWLEYINPTTQLLAEKQSPIGLLAWNHLWFLPYLLLYTLITLCIYKPLTKLSESSRLHHLPLAVPIGFVIITLIVFRFWLGDRFPTTHDLINDFYNHSKYGLVFFTGFIFAKQQNWWNSIIQSRRFFLIIALLTYSFFIADRNMLFPTLAASFSENVSVQVFYRIIGSTNLWFWLFAVVGYAGHYLNRPSKLLTTANQGILPWYMLHQTVIIMLAWWLKPFTFNAGIEAILLLLLTISLCLILYICIERVPLLRFLFGLKLNTPSRLTLNQLKIS